MKLLSKICMPALMLGAAALMAPAMAQDDTAASANNSAEAAQSAQPSQDANSATPPAESAMSTSSNGGAIAPSSGNTQMAMNTTGNAGDLSSIPDTQHKYTRAKRSSDFQSEAATTKQLNQKESSLNGASGNPQ